MDEQVDAVMDVLSRRQQCRNEWEQAVREDWNSLALWQQLHCTNLTLLERWWPGTQPANEETDDA